jgi:deoxyadenosine/deoxycytidine kinase
LRKKEVPQDESSLNKVNSKELYYAVDENGEYTTALSSGWDPKKIALDNALEDIEQRIADAKRRVEARQTSPVEYFMELSKMDLPILASYVGFWQWRVKKHFKPTVFKKLSQKQLQKYADVFDITVDQLQNI